MNSETHKLDDIGRSSVFVKSIGRGNYRWDSMNKSAMAHYLRPQGFYLSHTTPSNVYSESDRSNSTPTSGTRYAVSHPSIRISEQGGLEHWGIKERTITPRLAKSPIAVLSVLSCPSGVQLSRAPGHLALGPSEPNEVAEMTSIIS